MKYFSTVQKSSLLTKSVWIQMNAILYVFPMKWEKMLKNISYSRKSLNVPSQEEHLSMHIL